MQDKKPTGKIVPFPPMGPIVPFPDWMLRKLANALPGTGVIGLVGPPGSGKRAAVRQAATMNVEEYYPNKFLDLKDMEQLIRCFQPTFKGKCIWVVHPASLLSKPLVRAMANRRGSHAMCWSGMVRPRA